MPDIIASIDNSEFDRFEALADARIAEQFVEARNIAADTERVAAVRTINEQNRAITLSQLNSVLGTGATVMRSLITASGGTLDQSVNRMIDTGLVALSIGTAANALTVTSGVGAISAVINLGLQGVQLANLVSALAGAEDALIQIDAQTSASIQLINSGLTIL